MDESPRHEFHAVGTGGKLFSIPLGTLLAQSVKINKAIYIGKNKPRLK